MDVFSDVRPEDLRRPVKRLRVRPGAKVPAMLLGDFRAVGVHWIEQAGRSMPHVKKGDCPWCPLPTVDHFFGPALSLGTFDRHTGKWKLARAIVDLTVEGYIALAGRDLSGLPIVLYRGGSQFSPVLVRFPLDHTGDDPASIRAALDALEAIRARQPQELQAFDIVPHLWRMWGLTPESLRKEQLKIHRPAKEA